MDEQTRANEKFFSENWGEVCDEGAEFEGWLCVADDIVDTRRGHPVHQIVVRNENGELWQFLVVEADDEWSFYGGVARVKPVEVTVIHYRVVRES